MIKADVKVTDNSSGFLADLAAAIKAGLTGSALAYQRDMKRALRSGGKGYVFKTTTGNVGNLKSGQRKPWTQGILWNSVTLGPIEPIGDGFGIRVGTDDPKALYWELGHHNIFTRHFERDEKWMPTFRNNQGRYADAFRRGFTADFKDLQAEGAATLEGADVGGGESNA